MASLTGSIVAIVSPMHDDGSLDLDAFRKLIDWHIAEGTDGIVVVGTTGESPTVDFDEHHLLIKTAVEHGNRRVVRYEHNGSITVLADQFDGFSSGGVEASGAPAVAGLKREHPVFEDRKGFAFGHPNRQAAADRRDLPALRGHGAPVSVPRGACCSFRFRPSRLRS